MPKAATITIKNIRNCVTIFSTSTWASNTGFKSSQVPITYSSPNSVCNR